MSFSERLKRFRAWQREPIHYTTEGLGEHRCANCGHTFEGNYCPVCGQAADDGPITWKALRRSIMAVWGMGSRSAPVTIWQLLWRPGHLMRDYLSGHKRASCPPMNLLFIMAVVYAIAAWLANMMYGTPTEIVTQSTNEGALFLNKILNWSIKNPGWTTLILTTLMTLPTWFLFRHAPRHPHHTLPEGIYIQIFMSSLMLLSVALSTLSHGYLFLLVPIYYFVAYKQLFGYGVWGTVWRLGACFFVWTMMIVGLALVAAIIGKEVSVDNGMGATISIIALFGVLFVVIPGLTMGGGWLIGWLGEKRRNKKAQADR